MLMRGSCLGQLSRASWRSLSFRECRILAGCVDIGFRAASRWKPYTTLTAFGDNCNDANIITARIVNADVDIAERTIVCIFEVWVGGAQHIMTHGGYIATIIGAHLVMGDVRVDDNARDAEKRCGERDLGGLPTCGRDRRAHGGQMCRASARFRSETLDHPKQRHPEDEYGHGGRDRNNRHLHKRATPLSILNDGERL